jgi:hypothetical protein
LFSGIAEPCLYLPKFLFENYRHKLKP